MPSIFFLGIVLFFHKCIQLGEGLFSLICFVLVMVVYCFWIYNSIRFLQQTDKLLHLLSISQKYNLYNKFVFSEEQQLVQFVQEIQLVLEGLDWQVL